MRGRLRTAVSVLVLVLVAGCGGGDKDEGDDFAQQPAAEIADAAKADMQELDSVTYTGEITSEGDSITVDVQASSSGDCTGTIGLGEGKAEVLAKDGDAWFRPDEAFWRQQAPDQAELIIATVGDKWVVDSNEQFAQFCDLDDFFDSIFADDDAAEYKSAGTDELDGQQVVKIDNTNDEGTSTGYVLVDDPHYLLKVERTEGEEPGQIEFGDFDKELELEAPGEDEVIDLSQS